MIYALLVGIDNYPEPIRRLQGCRNDATEFAELLQGFFSADQLNLRVLLDQQATRQAVIQALRDHLGQAGANDTALFFFAGHGSQERAPVEFWCIEPDRLNETLVCHDSRQPNGWDLADKELALLLNEIGSKGSHTVVILDCCHSGSGTRAAASTDSVRRVPTHPRERPLDAFLPGVLELSTTRKLGETGWDSPATASHVLMAACRDDQEAKESQEAGQCHGAFSSVLLAALGSCAGRLTYRELHNHVQARIQVSVAAQVPQLEATDAEDLDRPFLGGDIVDQEGIYTVSEDPSGAWTIDGGIIHGIAGPIGAETTQLVVFPFGTPAAAMGSMTGAIAKAHVEQVMPHGSTIAIDSGTLEAGKTYRAVVTGHPLPALSVRLEGDAGAVETLRQVLQTASIGGGPSPEVREVRDPGAREELRVRAKDGEYGITRSSDGRSISDPVLWSEREAAQVVVSRLEHVARWMRVARLENSASRVPADAISLEVFEGATADTPLQGSEIGLVYVYHQERHKWIQPTFRVRLTNRSSSDLYCSIVGLSEQYGVGVLLPAGTVLLKAGTECWAKDGKELYASVPDRLWKKGITQSHDILKLIASTTDFNVRLIAQPDIDQLPPRSASRGIGEKVTNTLERLLGRIQLRSLSAEAEDDEEINDFFTKSLTVTTTRPRDTVAVSADAAATLESGVVIDPHPTFRGRANLTNAQDMGREIGSMVEPQLFRDQPNGVTPLQLNPLRSTERELTALELSDIHGSDSVTPESPLRIRVPYAIAANERVVAVGFDGEFFLPLGSGRPIANQTVIELERLPAPVIGRRSLTGSIRILFHKLVLQPLGVPYTKPRLACVDRTPDGSVVYDVDAISIQRRVAAASRILLFVHGILGDTASMAGSLASSSQDELVMGFDYENLHTTIEQNGELLRQRLEAVGLGAGHGKELQIVAHSMGGLVSRWFIESAGGNHITTQLVMLGTPNQGSPWSSVQDLAGAAMALALNGLTAMAWPAQALAWAIGAIEHVDNSLDEMKPGSALLTTLAAAQDPHVPYRILVGNTSIIPGALAADANGQTLVERMLKRLSPRQVGHALLTAGLFQAPNDIAVSVTSSEGVGVGRQPQPTVSQLACDHLTYFTTEAGLAALEQAVGWKRGPSASTGT